MKSEDRRRMVSVFSLVIVVVLLLLLAGNVSAAWWNPVGWVIKAFELASGVIKQLINLVKMIMSLTVTDVMNFIAKIVKLALEKFFDVMKYFLTLNPTAYCPPTAAGCTQNSIIGDIAPIIMTIIQPFYITMVIFTGMYYIFAAMEPKRRAAAKNMLLKLLVGMVIVGLALPIFQLILDISSELTGEVFKSGYKEFASQSSKSIAVFAAIIVTLIVRYPSLLVIALLALAYIIVAVLMVMAIRYVAVVILAILFPAALFLYFFDATKNLGASLVYQTISWIFVPVVQAFMIVITFFALEGMLTLGSATVTNPNTMQSLISSLNPMTAILMFFMIFGGLAGVIVAPMVMMQFMKWAGGAVAGYGMLKIPQAQTKEEFWKAAGLTTLGGTMMGGLSRGLPFGMTQAAYMAQQFAPTFGDAASWGDVMPSMGEMRGWFRGGGSKPAGGGAAGGQAGGQGGGAAAPWTGAYARARVGGGQGRGLVRDFFETYRNALNYDRIKSAELVDKYGQESGSRAGSASGTAATSGIGGERGIPLSPATTLAGRGVDQYGQYSTIYDDSSGARGRYLGKVEGPPFFSIPIYLAGGQWGENLKRAATAFKEGRYGSGVGISLFETFKIFSPFRPVRHLGRILYTAIPEFVPPYVPFPVPFIGWSLRDVAWWGSRRMMGVGLGQMASRGGWNLSLAAAEGDFNSAVKRLRKAENMKDGDSVKKAREDMDKAAKEYAKTLDGIMEGTGIRKMSDPDYYNRKLEQLRDYNKDLHLGVMKNLTTGIGIESRGDVINAVELSVRKAGGSRDKLEAKLKKELDAIKYPDDKEKEAKEKEDQKRKNDMTLLLFDYIGEKHGSEKVVDGKTMKVVDEKAVKSFLDSPSEDKGIGDFMKYNAAMKFGIGVSEWGFNREAYEMGKAGVWSKKSFNLDEMEDYIKKHEGIGASLVTPDDGKFRMSAHRLLYGAAYNCATQNELVKMPDGRTLPNIYIFDAVDTTSGPEGKAYSFVNQAGSTYVEIMRNHYETSGSLQPIWGEKDPRTQQYLDAMGSGFKKGYSYRQTGDGFAVHHTDENGMSYILPKTNRDEVLLTSKEAAEKLGEKNESAITLKEAEEKHEEATHALGEYGLSESEKAKRQKAVEEANKKLVDTRNEAFKAVREKDVATYKEDLKAYVVQRYSGRYNLDQYMEELAKANEAIYFNGTSVQQLRERGYGEREIDHLKLVLYQNPRYGELIRRGETVDIRIADNPDNPNASWVNTDDLGRRSLTINVGSRAYTKEDHKGTPEQASKFMQHLQHGDLLAHEATHDRIREKYKSASFEEIWSDFVKDDSRMNDVFNESDLQTVKGEIAKALGIGVSELRNDKTIRRALRERGLTKEDLGFMLCEGLADVGASSRSVSRGDEQQGIYNDSMRTFVGSESRRISETDSIDLTGVDVSLLARMESLASQTADYVDKQDDRDKMNGDIQRAKSALSPEMLRGFDTQVKVYKAIHSHAIMI